MTGTYELKLGEETVGTVQVRREKLYYCFSCWCKLSGDVVFQLVAQTPERRENLGVLVPEDGAFTLKTRIPVKRFMQGIREFLLIPRHESVSGRFVPLSPEVPFAYLDRLEKAFLARRGGEQGILISRETEL